MSIIATNTGGNFEIVPSGTYVARCYSMVQIGTVTETIKGVAKQLSKVRLTWELPTKKKEFKPGEGLKPFSVSKEFTLSMNEKSNLRKFLEGWRGKAFTQEQAKQFDITKLLGLPCMLSVIHKTSGAGNQYADISSASALPEGMNCPDQVNANFEFSFSPYSEEKFKMLPDFLKQKISTTPEYYKALNPHHTEASAQENLPPAPADDLPF